MLGRLFFLFTVVPIVELYLLIQLGQHIGGVETIAIVLATGATGAWLARREGRRALEEIQTRINQGELPDDALLSGLLILIGGVLLITPGVITDAFGLMLLVPPIRGLLAKVARKRIGGHIQNRVLAEGVNLRSGFGPGFGPGTGFGPAEPEPEDVIDVEAEVRD